MSTQELPDDIREPLHSLQADLDYLVSRLTIARTLEEKDALTGSIRSRLNTIEKAVKLRLGKLKPFDLTVLMRDAFLTGRGLKDGDKLSAEDQKAWTDYDPTDMLAYGRVANALHPFGHEAITLANLQAAHTSRQEEWCPDQKPDLSFRGNEMAGEIGETIEALYNHIAELGKAAGRSSNLIKKLERERHGWRGSRATKEELGAELADVIHTAVLCAITAGIDIEAVTIGKFNETSEKYGLATKLGKA